MIVRASRNQPQSLFLQFTRKRFGVCQDLTLILFEVFPQRFAESDGLGGNDVGQWSTLNAWKELAVNFLRVFLLTKNQSTTRAPQRLVRGTGHIISHRHRRRMQTGGDWTGDVRDVGKYTRANSCRNLTDSLEVDNARIGGSSTDDQPRLVLFGNSLQLVVIDRLSLARNTVISDLITDAGKVHRVSVRQMPAVRKVHAKDLIAVL